MVEAGALNPIRICFVGDSIMHGTTDPDLLGWPGRACAMANGTRAPITMYNLGVRGDTTEDVRARWLDEAGRRLPPTVSGAIVFGFGLNDTLVDASGRPRVDPIRSIENTREILSAAQVRWPVLVVGPAPVDDSRLPPGVLPGVAPAWTLSNRRIAELSAQIEGVADGLRIPFLDLFAELHDDPEWDAVISRSDAVHPGSGYGLIADRFARWRPWLDLIGSTDVTA
jgi:lysophospholipase L1-like esterase